MTGIRSPGAQGRAVFPARLRSGRAAVVACLGLLLSASCTEPGTERAAANQITIGSNPAGTHVYGVAAGLAKILQERGGLRATIRPFSGSSVYLPMLQRGELALGLNTGIDSYLAYNGLPPYAGAMSNLRTLGAMFPLPIAYMVNAESDIHTVEDLRGRRVVVTFRANAALEQLHTGILATGGLGLGDVEPVTVAGLPEAMDMIREGRADAAPTGLNTALAMEVDSALPNGIRYITLGRQESRLAEIMPGTAPVTVMPGAAGTGIDADTRVANTLDYLNTSVAMSEETAYLIVKTIHENWDALRSEHVQMRAMADDGIVPSDNRHPYHPGAIRYYEEVGLWTEAHAANQALLLGE